MGTAAMVRTQDFGLQDRRVVGKMQHRQCSQQAGSGSRAERERVWLVELQKEQQDKRRGDREEGLQLLQEGCSSVEETFFFSSSQERETKRKKDTGLGWVMQEMVRNSTPSSKKEPNRLRLTYVYVSRTISGR